MIWRTIALRDVCRKFFCFFRSITRVFACLLESDISGRFGSNVGSGTVRKSDRLFHSHYHGHLTADGCDM